MAATAPKRICIIGNSMIAALLAAYRQFEGWPHHFEFFGSEAEAFRQIVIEKGWVGKARFKTGSASNNIADYDGFVIYGDTMPPHEIEACESKLRQAGYSAQVRHAALQEFATRKIAHGHAEKLRRETAAPIFILTSNIAVNENPLTATQYRHGITLLRALLAPATLIETPAILLRDGFIGDPAYYKGSIYDGQGQTATDPQCDATHLNIEGGRVMLHHIADTISAHFAVS